MNLRLMSLNIKEFVPVLSMPVVKQRVNVRYKQLLGAENWEFLKDSTTVNVEGIHSGSTSVTIAVTNGSTTVTGTGTSFTSYAAGDFLRINDEDQPYIISSITYDTTLVLETAYGGTTASSLDFDVFRTMYTPTVANVGEITSIAYQSGLKEVSEAWLNKVDPTRVSTGSPTHYRIVSKSKADGLVTFEIWPVPDQDYVVTVFYKKYVADMSADTDEPVFRPELIEAGALWDCYRLVFTITQNPAYIGLARDAKTDFERLLREAFCEDISTTSMPTRVRDIMEARVWDDNFTLSHDVGVL